MLSNQLRAYDTFMAIANPASGSKRSRSDSKLLWDMHLCGVPSLGLDSHGLHHDLSQQKKKAEKEDQVGQMGDHRIVEGEIEEIQITLPAATTTTTTTTMSCPICCEVFPKEALQRHVEECLNTSMELE